MCTGFFSGAHPATSLAPCAALFLPCLQRRAHPLRVSCALPHAAGRAWLVPNAPAVTQRQIVEAFSRAAGTSTKVSTVPRAAITVGGLVVPLLRELKETLYQFAEPWTTDSTRTETELGVAPTALAEGAAATVAWWRSQRG